MLLIGSIFLIVAIMAGIFAFGFLYSPAVGTFRIIFYLAVILFVVTLVAGIAQHSTQVEERPPREEAALWYSTVGTIEANAEIRTESSR